MQNFLTVMYKDINTKAEMCLFTNARTFKIS